MYNQKTKAILAFTLFTFTYSAQIIYTDLNPDSTVTATPTTQMASYFLNLDNSGTYEFELRHFNPSPGPANDAVELYGAILGSREILVTPTNHARVLNIGDSITAISGTWGIDLYGALNSPWFGITDKYLGLRFKISGQWHYAWARLELPTDKQSFIVKDYAYNSAPNTQINAGEVEINTTGIPETNAENVITIYPNPFRKSATLKLNFMATQAELTIYDFLGKKVKTIQQITGYNAIINQDDLNDGIYWYQLREGNNKLVSGKLMIGN